MAGKDFTRGSTFIYYDTVCIASWYEILNYNKFGSKTEDKNVYGPAVPDQMIDSLGKGVNLINGDAAQSGAPLTVTVLRRLTCRLNIGESP